MKKLVLTRRVGFSPGSPWSSETEGSSPEKRFASSELSSAGFDSSPAADFVGSASPGFNTSGLVPGGGAFVSAVEDPPPTIPASSDSDALSGHFEETPVTFSLPVILEESSQFPSFSPPVRGDRVPPPGPSEGQADEVTSVFGLVEEVVLAP